MRPLITIFIFALALLLISCSFGTDFVVINKSAEPIVVKYKLKKKDFYGNDFFIFNKPAIMAEKDLGRDAKWQELTPEQYKFRNETRTITVTVQPNDALLIERVRDYFEHDSKNASEYDIEEIDITGSNGEIYFQGEQARTAFIKNEKYFTLTYK